MKLFELARRCAVGALLTVTGVAAWCGNWQHSMGVDVEIGIRDPASPGYKAIFTVRSPDGQLHRKSIDVAGDEFGYVRFPSDFATDLHPGIYRWSASVGGREVTRGRFAWRTSKSGQRLLKLD